MAVIATALYSIPVAVFIFNSTYENIVLLYLGNILFAATVLFGVVRLNSVANNNAAAIPLFKVGWQITVIGVILTTVISVLLYFLQRQVVPARNVLSDATDHLGGLRTDDLFLSLISHSAGVNGVLGVLAAVGGAGVVKRNQKTLHGRDSND